MRNTFELRQGLDSVEKHFMLPFHISSFFDHSV